MEMMSAIEAREPESPGPLGRDADSFRAFYEVALPRVYGYFLRRCGGIATTAEDLTQETFLAAVRELRKGRPVEVPVAWVLGIARHKLVDHYRRQERSERTHRLALDDRVELVTDDGHDVGELATAALARVPASQRTALVLRHLDGLSVPEIASALGRSVEAVESLLARGRVSFKRAYGEVLG
jgi:RNA polymerase sigma-70 factor (ECF subfamily)